MAMSAAALSTGLQNLTPTNTEGIAITRFVNAWGAYFGSSAANGVPYAFNGAHASAMASALSGMSAPGAGAAKIQAGIVAWWASVLSTFAVTYAGSIALVVPPTLTAIAAGLAPVLASNTSGALSLAASCDAVANVIHTNNLGGTATFPPAVVAPIL